MSALAIIGWLALLCVGAYLFLAGCYFAWITAAFCGRIERLVAIPIALGGLIIGFAIHSAPFSIVMEMRP